MTRKELLAEIESLRVQVSSLNIALDSLKNSEARTYHDGYKQALWDYAWLQDGKYYVGQGVLTYQEALEKSERVDLPKEPAPAPVNAEKTN